MAISIINTTESGDQTMPVNSIHHIAISVRDLERSGLFYKDTFGFDEVQRFERKDLGGRAVFLKLGDMRIEIWEFQNGIVPKDDPTDLKIYGMRHIAFSVTDLDKAYADLKSKIEISEPRLGASGNRYCFISDPDGIPIELYENRIV